MKRLVQILVCAVAALALVPLHGESAEIMEYEFETEIAVTAISASETEIFHKTQEKETPSTAARPQNDGFAPAPVHSLPVTIDRVVLFREFRE